jgi:acetyl esterase/lipase
MAAPGKRLSERSGCVVLATMGIVAIVIMLAAAVAAFAADREPVLLWPGGAPGAKGNGPEDTPRITPYLPAGGGPPRGCIIVFPGGGYVARAPHESGPIAEWLRGLGLAGMVLDYRVSPYRHPLPLGDAQRGIRLVRSRAAEWNIDPRRVGVLGFSAGGHLAACASNLYDDGRPDAADPVERQPCRPDAAVLCYSLISMYKYTHRQSAVNLLGPSPDPKLCESLSMQSRVTPRTPPTFLWHTADDRAVPVEDSLMYADALAKSKVPFALHVFPRGDHGLGLAPDRPEINQWTALCAGWLKGIGFLPT